ncbi:MAG: phospholipid carrier-dependent glycosyltransferase [Caldiserica bacterium]|nr:phospholipid carrier-dependent glycosyltransferase [Caldisericota bacterium]
MVIPLFFIFFVFLFKLPFLNFPYHWDALGFTIPHALSIYRNNFNPFVSPYDAGHPPLFYFLLASAWKILGVHPWASRIILYLFVAGALYYTYLIGKELKIRIFPWLPPLLLFISPLFFAQSGILNLEIPLTTFMLFSFYQYLKGNKTLLTLGLTMLLLTKISGIIFFLSLLISHLVISRGKLRKKDFTWIFFPLLAMFAWLMIHKLKTGWALYPPYLAPQREITFKLKEIFSLFLQNMKELPGNPSLILPFSFLALLTWKEKLKGISLLLSSILISLLIIFLPQSLPLAIMVFLFFLIYLAKKASESFGYLFTCIFFIINLSFYSLFTSSLPRYLLPLYPFFFLIFSLSLGKFPALKSASPHEVKFRPRRGYFYLGEKTIFVALIIFFAIMGWSGTRQVSGEGSGAKLETNLEYAHMVKSHLSATRYIETEFPEAKILTTWPQVIELSIPEAGYVRNPYQVIYLDNYKKGMDYDLIYYSPQSHEERKLREIIQQGKPVLLYKKNINGKKVSIYKRNR